MIYLDGNSLGRLPKRSIEKIRDVVERQWGHRLIRAWSEGWFEASQRIGAKIARLLGAEPEEVIVADSTSVNLFKLVLAALQARPGRTRVLSDHLNFPSDLCVLQSALALTRHHRLEIALSDNGIDAPLDALARSIDERT